jgi:glutamate decarboxylase
LDSIINLSALVSYPQNSSANAIRKLHKLRNISSGISGYQSVMAELTKTADSLAEAILSVASGSKFVLMSKTGGNGLPIVVWRLKNEAKYDGKIFLKIPILQAVRDA